MKLTAASLLTLLAFSTSLEAVKLTIDGFEGFYDAAMGQKMPDWCVRQKPDAPDSDPQHMYKELQIEVFTSQEVPTHRLSGYNRIPAAKACDQLKKGPFIVTAEEQTHDVGDLPANTYLNIVFTAQHEVWDENGNRTANGRELVSHAILPPSLFDGVDDFRLSLIGMSLFSWTVPSEEPEDICLLSQANADGTITIGNKVYPMGYWPSEDNLTVKFTDRRKVKDDPICPLSTETGEAALKLANPTAYVFTDAQEDVRLTWETFKPVLESDRRKWIVNGETPEQEKEYQHPKGTHSSSGRLQIAMTGEVLMNGNPLTFAMLSHKVLPWDLTTAREVEVQLNGTDISIRHKGIETSVDYFVRLVLNNGEEIRFFGDSEFWHLTSY